MISPTQSSIFELSLKSVPLCLRGARFFKFAPPSKSPEGFPDMLPPSRTLISVNALTDDCHALLVFFRLPVGAGDGAEGGRGREVPLSQVLQLL